MNDTPTQQQNDSPIRDKQGRWLPGQKPEGAKPWQPGESGNPGGAVQGQAQPGRWLGALCDLPETDLVAICQDQYASASKRAAARLILDALDDDPSTRRRALSMICDRTEGKPGVNLSIHQSQPTQSIDEMHGRLHQLMAASPYIANMARAILNDIEGDTE